MHPLEKHLITSRDKIKKNPSKVGQAVFDILSKDQKMQTVEETIEGMTPKYFEEVLKAVDRGCKAYNSPFYVVVVRKKETLGGMASNVLFHRFVDRQTMPSPKVLREDYPNADHEVYEVNAKTSTISLLWVLPTAQDSRTIVKNKHLYDPMLVGWIEQFDRDQEISVPLAS